MQSECQTDTHYQAHLSDTVYTYQHSECTSTATLIYCWTPFSNELSKDQMSIINISVCFSAFSLLIYVNSLCGMDSRVASQTN